MILNFLNVFAYSIITALILVVFLLYTLKKTIPNMIENEKEYIISDVENYLNSEKGQKNLFLIGGMLSNGMKTGLGLTAKGGKFKMEDLAAQLIGGFIQQKFLNNPQNVPNLPNQPQKNINTVAKPFKSKY